MAPHKNDQYQAIWNFLDGKASETEEKKLLEWIALNRRNETFFDEVVLDFNQLQLNCEAEMAIPSLSVVPKLLKFKYHLAASIMIVISSSALFFFVHQQNAEGNFKTVFLSDSTKIVLSEGSHLIYDSLNYKNTGIIKIEGAAFIYSPEDPSHLISIDTEAGYYLMKTGIAYIENFPNKATRFEQKNGEGDLINYNDITSTINVSTGEILLFNKENQAYDFSLSFHHQNPI